MCTQYKWMLFPHCMLYSTQYGNIYHLSKTFHCFYLHILKDSLIDFHCRTHPEGRNEWHFASSKLAGINLNQYLCTRTQCSMVKSCISHYTSHTKMDNVNVGSIKNILTFCSVQEYCFSCICLSFMRKCGVSDDCIGTVEHFHVF